MNFKIIFYLLLVGLVTSCHLNIRLESEHKEIYNVQINNRKVSTCKVNLLNSNGESYFLIVPCEFVEPIIKKYTKD